MGAMKKSVLLIIFILSFINATDAQWYKWHNRACGIMDINNCTAEEFACLWAFTTQEVRVGSILTGIGTSGIVIGLLFLNFGSDDLNAGIGFALFGGIGIGLNLGGIPTRIAGANRKSKLRVHPKYDILKYGSLKVSPTIGLNQFNNSYNYGVTLSFTF